MARVAMKNPSGTATRPKESAKRVRIDNKNKRGANQSSVKIKPNEVYLFIGIVAMLAGLIFILTAVLEEGVKHLF